MPILIQRFPQDKGGIFMDKQRWQAIGCGLAAGAVNGLFGAGGGMLLVPLLQRFRLLEQRALFASALAIMLPMSMVSFGVYYLKGAVELGQALPYCVGGFAGGLIGGLVYRKIPTALLHRALGLLILWGGVRLLLKM